VGTLQVRPRLTGKIATVLQMAVVLWILLKWSVRNDEWSKIINLGTALFTGASGLLYIWDGMRQLGTHPSSSPTSGQAAPDNPA
jgi:phosphatidylglycerophosphate synthase